MIGNMGNMVTIHADKAGPRVHFIAEWLEHRGLSQAEIVRELGVNKGTVSKWCSGALPAEDNLRALAAFLELEPVELFRHPQDDWLTRFFMNRSTEQLKQMVATLNAAFPRKDDERVRPSVDQEAPSESREKPQTKNRPRKRR
ncbi:MAG TPA: helix-turn-helix transcriptional regulator [Methylosinus sp.]|jgi:transcriptional regulator with XRE-family HTH domain|uniref:helix-turn-helix domain-containing protein n=1 Tax=Methylosinus sp. TaxID=427 RepID=UPI002F947CF4